MATKSKPLVRFVPIGELIPDKLNANKGTKRGASAVAESLRRYGAGRSIVLDRNNQVIAGNKTLAAARKAGFKRVAVFDTTGDTMVAVGRSDLDLDDAKARELAIADNRTSELGLEWDPDALKLLDVDLSQFWNDAELRKLIGESSEADELPEPHFDRADELQKKWQTAPGQMWSIGAHTLLCGDSTDEEVIGKLLGTKKATMCFTDPPWNVAIGGDNNPRHRQRKGLQNDSISDSGFAAFIGRAGRIIADSISGDLYCVMSSSQWPVIDATFREAKMYWSGTIVWTKDTFVLGRSNYHRRFEPIWYGWPEGSKSSFCGGRDQDDVWEFARPKVSAEHPTMKPVSLVLRAIRNSSAAGGLVFDPFAGAGTTLLAAELSGRVGRCVEIDPRFVAVCLERATEMGLKPQRSGHRELHREQA